MQSSVQNAWNQKPLKLHHGKGDNRSFSLSIEIIFSHIFPIFWKERLSKIMQKINNNLHFTQFSPLSIFLHIVVVSKRSFNGIENALCSHLSNEESEGQNDSIHTHIWGTGLDSHLVSASPPSNLFR